MTIQLSTRAAADALADYLGRCGCNVSYSGERTLRVAAPARSQSARDAAIELEAYLKVFRAMHPAHTIERIDPAE
jgi:hypothetical protein